MPYKDIATRYRYQVKWIQNRRNKWLIDNGPCKKCGTWLNLEVDHIDPTTKVSHNVWGLVTGAT